MSNGADFMETFTGAEFVGGADIGKALADVLNQRGGPEFSHQAVEAGAEPQHGVNAGMARGEEIQLS